MSQGTPYLRYIAAAIAGFLLATLIILFFAWPVWPWAIFLAVSPFFVVAIELHEAKKYRIPGHKQPLVHWLDLRTRQPEAFSRRDPVYPALLSGWFMMAGVILSIVYKDPKQFENCGALITLVSFIGYIATPNRKITKAESAKLIEDLRRGNTASKPNTLGDVLLRLDGLEDAINDIKKHNFQKTLVVSTFAALGAVISAFGETWMKQFL